MAIVMTEEPYLHPTADILGQCVNEEGYGYFFWENNVITLMMENYTEEWDCWETFIEYIEQEYLNKDIPLDDLQQAVIKFIVEQVEQE